jgi:Kae1-associated kinase Bud32
MKGSSSLMLLGEGAEGRVESVEGRAVKSRPTKSYRHPELDQRLRRFRTRREAKVIERLPVKGPSLLRVDDKAMTIEMTLLAGPQLRDVLDETNVGVHARRLGELVRLLHDEGIVHGDLTTSNVLLVDGELHLIDFGLSAFSVHVEDRAVDLHLLRCALSAKHPSLGAWEHFIVGYGDAPEVLERLEAVERRGRNKQKGS